MPEGWSWTRIQNITQICLGLTHTPKYVESGIPFYSVKDISSGGLDTTNPKYISAAEFEKFPDGAKPQYGDILFGRVGTLGKPTIVNTNSPFGIFVSLGFFRKYSHEITSEFFVHWMNSSLFWDQVNMNVKGAVLTNLNTGWLSKFLIPIPPSKEQTRIVAQCEIAIRYLEEIENTGREISNLISATKSKILDLAIRGKLVPQDPNDEPASVLLERIRAEKEELIKQGKIKRDKKESVIFKGDDNSYYLNKDGQCVDIGDENPFDIPNSWEWTLLGNIVQLNPRNKISDDMEVSFVPMPLIDDGFSGNHASEIRKWNDVKTGFTHFAEGDIGVAKITPCFENRKSTIFKNLCNGYGAGTTELHILRTYADTISHKFLLSFVKTDYFIQAGKQTFSGAVGQQRIGKEYISNSLFPLPPLAEQKRIVNTIEALFAQIDKISEQIS